MTVLTYMAIQRDKIRARHSGEEFFFQGTSDKNAPVKLDEYRSASVILDEIDGMKGLNVAGRILFARKNEFLKKSGYAV